jgi:GMP synthase-like glutamine amidotransferase
MLSCYSHSCHFQTQTCAGPALDEFSRVSAGSKQRTAADETSISLLPSRGERLALSVAMVQALPQLSRNLRPYLESIGRPTESFSSAASNNKKDKKTLRLAQLGCETNEPYGPIQHTGELFLALLEQASRDKSTVFRIDLFNAKKEEYPDDWSVYHGVIIPGSFSAAYDDDPWILQLQRVIQNFIVARHIPTLGICFGHQLVAHSYDDGCATATPSGARGGRFFVMPAIGRQHHTHQHQHQQRQNSWLDDGETGLHLYYTHGDMVAQLPETAVCLGGDDVVPIQAAAYFGTIAEKDDWVKKGGGAESKQPFAVTLQAHPEYATSMDQGVERTLCRCLQAQADRGAIANQEEATRDAITAYEQVKSDSVKVMTKVLTMLGWD